MTRSSTFLALGLAAAVAGCSSAGSDALSLASADDSDEVSALPSLSALKLSASHVPGTPTEVYTRIARGALTCWFGASGFLKGTYIYHADAQPPSKGGRSVITIFAKDTSASDPRALRAFLVSISPPETGTEPKVGTENLKVPEPLAQRMAADVDRWASDQEGCGEAPVTAGWSVSEAQAKAGAKAKQKK